MNARADAADRVARWVTDRVREVAPPGLGHWPPAWDRVEGPSLAFLDALDRWEQTGTPDDREAARQAAGAVVTAWSEAARQWDAAGRDVDAPSTAEAAR